MPLEPAGAPWCARFPTGVSLDDLQPSFGAKVKAFVEALRDAGAAVTINATYRPAERAYLMHFCCLVAGYQDGAKISHQIAPADVPPMTGVDIDWTCADDLGAALAAAAAMRDTYKIVYPAALVSNHTRRLAVDMTIQFKGALHIRTGHGSIAAAACQSDLWPIGASYGVHKLPSDAPHWSVDGH